MLVPTMANMFQNRAEKLAGELWKLTFKALPHWTQNVLILWTWVSPIDIGWRW